jgi:hypothetical protein
VLQLELAEDGLLKDSEQEADDGGADPILVLIVASEVAKDHENVA